MSRSFSHEFDFWKTKDGTYMVRVKFTGEVTKVSAEVMRLLWRTEKKSMEHDEAMADDLPEADTDVFEDTIARMLLAELKASLTERQLDVFEKHFEQGQPVAEYAKENHIVRQSVYDTIEAIRKKLKKLL